jgi:hypothetical protein
MDNPEVMKVGKGREKGFEYDFYLSRPERHGPSIRGRIQDMRQRDRNIWEDNDETASWKLIGLYQGDNGGMI